MKKNIYQILGALLGLVISFAGPSQGFAIDGKATGVKVLGCATSKILQTEVCILAELYEYKGERQINQAFLSYSNGNEQKIIPLRPTNLTFGSTVAYGGQTVEAVGSSGTLEIVSFGITYDSQKTNLVWNKEFTTIFKIGGAQLTEEKLVFSK